MSASEFDKINAEIDRKVGTKMATGAGACVLVGGAVAVFAPHPALRAIGFIIGTFGAVGGVVAAEILERANGVGE